MAINLGSAYGKVILDSSGWVKGIDNIKKSTHSLQSVGDDMKRWGQGLTAALTLPIAALGAQSVKLASAMVETRAKVKVVFGDMTDYVDKWSEGSAKSMQISQQEALESAATFGNLFVAMKIGKEDAAKMSTTLVQLAGDLASINNIDPSVALIKLKSGIVGETEAVRDLGIDLRMTVVEAKAAEMGFKELNGQFSQGDLIAARYAIIMEQTAVAQGDIARTGGELAGQMRTLNAQWKDALIALGTNLLPVALKFVTFLNQMLEKFNNLSPKQQAFIGKLVLLVAVIGPLLILFGTLLPMLGKLGFGFHSSGLSIFGLISGILKLITVAGTIVTVLNYFGVATGAVGAGILGLNAAIAGTAASIASVVFPVLLVIGVIALLYIAWKKNLFGIQDLVAKSAAGYRQAWQRFTDWWQQNTNDAGENVKAMFAAMPANIQSAFQRFTTSASAGWATFMTWLRNALTQARNYLSTAFTNVNWGQVGKFILSGLANGMLLGLPNLLIVAGKIVKELLTKIKKDLGIASDSKVATQLGYFTGHGFAKGIAMGAMPEDIARSLTKPITQNSNSNQQVINQHFASGLTLTQVRGMIEQNNEQLVNTMVTALSG